MNDYREAVLLRVFVRETDRHGGLPLYRWIVERANQLGLAGATVLRGIEGFGNHHQIHTASILRLADELPMVIEIVDRLESVEPFVEELRGILKSGSATLERVRHLRFGAGIGAEEDTE